jgi:hypothetical protein
MQAKPHPSQLLSLRETGLWVNAFVPAVKFRGKPKLQSVLMVCKPEFWKGRQDRALCERLHLIA